MRDNKVFALCEACYNPSNTTYDKCYDALSDTANDIIAANEDVQAQFENAYDTVCTADADCSNEKLVNERVINEVCKHHREEVIVAANNVAVGRQKSYPIESADFPGEEEACRCAYCEDREYFVLGILIGMVAMYAILHFNLHSKVIKMIRRR